MERDGRDGSDTTDQKGVWNEISRGAARRFWGDFKVEDDVVERCTALSEEKRCNIQLTKHLLCKVWPLAPEHVTPFSECSYEFVEIQRWMINPPQSE